MNRFRLRYRRASKSSKSSRPEITDSVLDQNNGLYNEWHFNRMLRLEEKRTERSRKPFLLMLLNVSRLSKVHQKSDVLCKIEKVMASCLRETDIMGWYEERAIIGIILTEMSSLSEEVAEKLLSRLKEILCQTMEPTAVNEIEISLHIFPEDSGSRNQGGKSHFNSFPRPESVDRSNRLAPIMKRVIDVLGSAIVLVLFSPLFLIIAVAIKVTSVGPVFFKQERLGLRGEKFVCLKFRSMHTNCDRSPHQEYIKNFIGGQRGGSGARKEGIPGIYKLQQDQRITPMGVFLRKTSLDEFPQFINVLKGEMSLVGPRPPIPYEYGLYDLWHRRRLLKSKPGITGLWQVKGRSRTTFDEMVRLDLQYLREWSLWLDVKILLRTPRAVFSCKGAY